KGDDKTKGDARRPDHARRCSADGADAQLQRRDAAGQNADDRKGDREIGKAAHAAQEFLRIAHAPEELYVVGSFWVCRCRRRWAGSRAVSFLLRTRVHQCLFAVLCGVLPEAIAEGPVFSTPRSAARVTMSTVRLCMLKSEAIKAVRNRLMVSAP